MLKKKDLITRLVLIQNQIADLKVQVMSLERSVIDLTGDATSVTPQKNPSKKKTENISIHVDEIINQVYQDGLSDKIKI